MIDRRNFLVNFTMAASAASFLKPFDVFADVGAKIPMLSGKNVLTILHTANIKGQWSSIGNNEKLAGLGGLKNIANKITVIRKDNPAVVVIDAGNLTSHRQTREERLKFYKEVSNAGYDVVIPGQNDLERGTTSFTQSIKESNLNADSFISPLKVDYILPYSLFRKGKIQVGVINAGTSALNDAYTSASQAKVAINRTAQLLRSSKNCTIIICVVQSSGTRCLTLAGLSYGIDVIISSAEKTSLHNTQIVRNDANHEVIVSYAGSKGSMISRIDFAFNDMGEKINVASKAIFAGASSENYAGILKQCAMYDA